MSEEDTRNEVLPLRVLFLYGAPVIGVTSMFWLVMLYFLKYTTDVLDLPPVWVGALFGLARLWDAASDPLVGYWSDRTTSRLGRRRPWMLASALPVALAFAALWSQPAGLGPTARLAWIGVGILVFYTAQTLFAVPHASLGAEFAASHHGRTRIYGYRACFEVAGVGLAIAALHALENSATPSLAAGQLSLGLGLVAGVGIVFAGLGLRERAEYRGRGARRPFAALRDVWRNPHARLLLAVLLLMELGYNSLLVVLPFASEHVLHLEGGTSLYLVVFAVALAGSLPLWIPVARRLGKKNAWLLSSTASAVGIAAIAFVDTTEPMAVFGLAALIGVMQGASQIVPLSIQADVVDYDELQTGERKEGAYFAAWNLARKAGGSLAVVGVGVLLQTAGVASDANPESLEAGILLALCGLPVACLGLATLLLVGLRLGEAEHREICDEIRVRVQARSALPTSPHV